MSRVLSRREMNRRIAARDAERDAAEQRRAMIAADRREEWQALSELTISYKTR